MGDEHSEIGFRFFDEINKKFEQLGERMEVFGCAYRALDELNLHYSIECRRATHCFIAFVYGFGIETWLFCSW